VIKQEIIPALPALSDGRGKGRSKINAVVLVKHEFHHLAKFSQNYKHPKEFTYLATL
jgi:hypothetical protein